MIYVLFSQGQTFSCKGSVDTTINGVDTMAQSKGRNVKKRSTIVDNRPWQVDTSSVDTTINGVDTMAQSKGRNVKKRSTSVDTRPGQVDTSDRSQRNMLTGLYLRSTPNASRSTLDGSPRRPVLLSGT
ncbi:hypothetical protein Taro_002466, partial [Colocasia esculenta]|nr:hypothetical protein [Colocasia esculenta]